MKITRHGTVLITKDSVLITGFGVDGQRLGNHREAESLVISWAMKQLRDRRRKQNYTVSPQPPPGGDQ